MTQSAGTFVQNNQIFTGGVSPGSTSPWGAPGLWDSINIAGVQYGWGLNPSVGGKVVVRKPCRHYRIDQKTPNGGDGSIQTYSGVEPKEFDVDFHMWTEAQWQAVTTQVVPAITYAGTKGKVQAYSMYHPATFLLSITSVEIIRIGAPENILAEQGDRHYVLTVIVREFRKPPPAVNVTKTPDFVGPPAPPGLGLPQGRPPSPARQQALDALKAAKDKAAEAYK